MCSICYQIPITAPDIQQKPSGSSAGMLRRWFALLRALVRQRCPRCREGRMFRGTFAMNDPCPVCGLIFQREEGYFLGAMYVSYVLSSALLLPFYFLIAEFFPNWNGILIATVAMLPFLPLSPAVFRYSRVLWIYLDRTVDPTDINAGPYEKFRSGNSTREGRIRGVAVPAGAKTPSGSTLDGERPQQIKQ
jgi:uncharacterized protein (DUF983 family)